MKVIGVSFIRNAIKYDYPVVAALQSILPICNELIVVLGKSEDNTEQLIQSIPTDKIKIIPTIWDDTKRKGGYILAEQTNIGLKHVDAGADWIIYIQADEVLPEYHHGAVNDAMQKWKDTKKVDGLLFKYLHFYGDYYHVADSPSWYRDEIRIIRNDPTIYSYKDAQGFRKGKNKKLKVKSIDASIHHYGWVKHPKMIKSKQLNFHKYWHDDQWIKENVVLGPEFDYGNIESVRPFKGKHPEVMKTRISQMDWHIDFSNFKRNLKGIQRVRYWIEKLTGFRIGEYKNYIRI